MSDECIIDNVNFIISLRPTFYFQLNLDIRDADHAVELEYLEGGGN